MAAVVDALFVHVGDVDVTVGARFDIDRAKPRIIGLQDSFDVFRFKRRLLRLEVAQHDLSLQRFDAEQLASKSLRQSVLFVDDEVVSEPRHTVMLDVLEEAERIRI